MLTDRKLLKLIYDSATCYIPREELNEEQIKKLENINYRWCNCKQCKNQIKQFFGHTDKNSIYIAKPFLKEYVSGDFLLRAIETTLHEIVHILFP